MKKENLNKLQDDLDKKAKTRERRKKPKMKVSGGSVKNLQKLISKKSKTV